MKKEQEYFRDLAEIRAMMERSSKFMSLSGWAGVLAGIYALVGAYVAYGWLDSSGPEENSYMARSLSLEVYLPLIALFMLILILALATAIFLSHQKAIRRGESAWNTTSKRLLAHMAVPLVAGGSLILILMSKGLIFLAPPLSLSFYGIALYNASKFTLEVLKYLGMIQILLGLAGACFPGYGLVLWAVGFGAFHIAYGTYMHYKYER